MGRLTSLGFCLLACLTFSSAAEGFSASEKPEEDPVQPRAQCPDSAAYYRKRCYELVENPISWDAAEVECQQLRNGGHLASIATASEERVISSLIRRFSTAGDAWIGLYAERSPKKLIWEWSDGTLCSPNAPLWDKRYPSTSLSTAECISLTNIQVPANTARWVQRACTTNLPFVCKYKASF